MFLESKLIIDYFSLDLPVKHKSPPKNEAEILAKYVFSGPGSDWKKDRNVLIAKVFSDTLPDQSSYSINHTPVYSR